MSMSEAAGHLCHFVIKLVELHKVWRHIQTYCPDDGSALTDSAAPVPDIVEETKE